ncbi:MAG: hypothetical protein IJ411_06520 [Oscillospiraceae bacterium]|nr:hypothetical protein [Oscillospiraceae bacterium]
MLEVMLFGRDTRDACKRILKKEIPGCLAAGLDYSKLPRNLREQISRKDEFILLRRPDPEEYWCIFDAGQDSVMRLAQRTHLRTLTCGFSPYDTLVLSSVSPEQAVVSLQREIYTAENRLLEPGDYLIHRSIEATEPNILFCTATMLLIDRNRNEHEFYF